MNGCHLLFYRTRCASAMPIRMVCGKYSLNFTHVQSCWITRISYRTAFRFENTAQYLCPHLNFHNNMRSFIWETIDYTGRTLHALTTTLQQECCSYGSCSMTQGKNICTCVGHKMTVKLQMLIKSKSRVLDKRSLKPCSSVAPCF